MGSGLDELLMQIEGSTDCKICEICGTPYKPYHSRQKTCGDPACKKAHKRAQTLEYIKRMKESDYESFLAYSRECQRRYRKRLKEKREYQARLHELNEDWDKATNPTEDGLNYGRRKAEELLQQLPKIDTGGDDDTVYTDDDAE